MFGKLSIAIIIATTAFISGCSSSSSSPTATPQQATATSNALGVTGPTTPVVLNGTFTVSAYGGAPPYSYYVVSGSASGSINPTTGLFTATDTEGAVVVGVSDSAGATATASISVGEGWGSSVVLSAMSGTTAVTSSVVVTQVVTLSANGGQAPYSYSLVSGDGTLYGNVYTAPAAINTGSVTLSVVDSAGDTNSMTLTIEPIYPLSLSPTSATIVAGQATPFTISGGIPPYTYIIESNGGPINGTFVAGTYTPLYAGTPVIEVEDSRGNIATADITVTANYATGTDTAYFQLIVDQYVAFSYDNAQSNNNPNFTFWDSGPNADGADVGKNCSYYSGLCENTVTLNNFSNSNFAYATYRGTIGMTGRGGAATVKFCIPPTNTNSAVIEWVSGGSAPGFVGSETTFIVYPWNLFGNLPAISAFTDVDPESGAGYATVSFNGSYTSNLDCSDFTSGQIIGVNLN